MQDRYPGLLARSLSWQGQLTPPAYPGNGCADSWEAWAAQKNRLKKEQTHMAIVHVNTDVMRSVGRCFHDLNEQIEENTIPAIRSGISQLEADWQGASRHRFEHLFNEWLSHARRLVELGEEIGQDLIRTADSYDRADNPYES